MEIDLPPEVETKLALLAHQRGIDAQALARTAIEHLVDHDAWFVGEVDKGLAQIDGGELSRMRLLASGSNSTSLKSTRVLSAGSLDGRSGKRS